LINPYGSRNDFEKIGGNDFWITWREFVRNVNLLNFARTPSEKLAQSLEILKAKVIELTELKSLLFLRLDLVGLSNIFSQIEFKLKELFVQKERYLFKVKKEEIESEIVRVRAIISLLADKLRENEREGGLSRRKMLKGALATVGVAAAGKAFSSGFSSSAYHPKTLLGEAFLHQLPKIGDITFEELKSLKEGEDYTISVVNRHFPLVLIAPHGGIIEPGTDILVKAIAGSDCSYYQFIALKQKCIGNRCKSLHITSTEFREPQLLALLKNAQLAIAIHSFGSLVKGEDGEEKRRIIVGGLSENICDKIIESLEREDFPAEEGVGKRFSGKSRQNFVNFPSSYGVQIEISRAMMREFFNLTPFSLSGELRGEQLVPSPDFYRFVGAIRQVLNKYEFNERRVAQK